MNLQHFARLQRRSVVSLSADADAHEGYPADVPGKLSFARLLLNEGQPARAAAMADAMAPSAPFDPDLLHLRGDCLIATGQPAEAVALFDKALLTMDTDGLWASKGQALLALKRHRRAASCYQRASALAPDAGHWRHVAHCLLEAGAPRDALATLQANHGDCGTLKARTLAQLGRRQDAMKDAWQAAGTSAEALNLLIDLAQTATETETARGQAMSLALAPDAPLETIVHAARVAGRDLGDKVVERLTRCCTDPETPQALRARAHLGLFRIFDQCDETEKAAQHLSAHHACASSAAPHQRSRDSALFTILMRLRFVPLPKTKSSLLPVFVTGLPGSGVVDAARVLQHGKHNRPARALTLVETVMTRFVRVLQREDRRDVTREDLLTLQSELREGLLQAADGADVLVDCARLNFRWSGLLAAALPEARIVHMTRDHVQTGWATYRADFESPGLACRHDMTHLASYLLRSAALMRHWESQLPGVIGVSGDALCRPGGKTARAMLQSCGLNWAAQDYAPAYAPNRDWHRYATTVAPMRNALRGFDKAQALQLPM